MTPVLTSKTTRAHNHKYIPHSKPFIGKEETEAVRQVLLSGQLAAGKNVDALEKTVRQAVHQSYGIAVSSGTAALHLSLLAMGVKKGDRVLVPSYVCTALLNAVNMTGATPDLCDVDPETGICTGQTVRSGLRKNTKAVIVPHLFGQPADIPAIRRLGVPVIEDCAQCVGADLNKKPAGGFGEISVFSFYATKVLCAGEGGMACTSDRTLAGAIRDLRSYDEKENYRIRFNYKLSDLHAALALAQFEKLPRMIWRRRKIASDYVCALKNLNLHLPMTQKNTDPIFYRFVVRIPYSVDAVIRKMEKASIHCARPVFRPLHRYLKLDAEHFPGTEEFFKKAISLPIYPGLRETEIQQIIAAVKNTINSF